MIVPTLLFAQKLPRLVRFSGDTLILKAGERVQWRYAGIKGFPITVDGPIAGVIDSTLWLADPFPYFRAEPVYFDRLGFVSAAVPINQITGFRRISKGKQWAHVGVQAAIAGSSLYLIFSQSPTSQNLRQNPWASISVSVGTALLSLGIQRLFFPRKVPLNIQNGQYRIIP